MPRLPEAADSGQAVIREVRSAATPDERWIKLRQLLATKRMSDPDARFVRDALIEVMDIAQPVSSEDLATVVPSSKGPRDMNATVEIHPGVQITPNDKGEITGDPERDKDL